MATTGETAVGSVAIAASPGATTCLRCLHRQDVNTIAYSHDDTAPALYSQCCDEDVLVPSPFTDLQGYTEALLSIAEREDVRTIIPPREQDAYVLSKHRERFAEHVSPVWPSFETLRLVHDRKALVEAARQAGVSAPRTQLLDSFEGDADQYVIKPRYSLLAPAYVDTLRSDQLAIVDSVIFGREDDEIDSEAIKSELKHEPICQKFIPGEEYGFWALYNEGEAVATCLKRQVRGVSYTGGTSVYRETIHDEALEKAGRNLLEHLDWHGLASVQFKRHAETGEYMLLEINPRVWTSISCPVRAGLDFPYYVWKLAIGEQPTPNTTYEAGIGTHRLGGELIHLRSILTDDNPIVESPSLGSSTASVARSVISNRGFDYLSVSDPLPFARDVLNNLDYLTGS